MQDLTCGVVELGNCSSALGLETRGSTAPIDNQKQTLDLQLRRTELVTPAGAIGFPDCLARGAEAILSFDYQPQLKNEFPIYVDIELADVPFDTDGRGAEIAARTPFIEGLYLRFQIAAEISNLSQNVEKVTVDWLRYQRDAIEKANRNWQEILEALQNKRSPDRSRLKEIGLATVPSIEEVEREIQQYGDLLSRIGIILDAVTERKGALLAEDLYLIIRRASEDTQGVMSARSREWFAEFEQFLGSQFVEKPIIRHIQVQWPLPEPHRDSLDASDAFRLLEYGWLYNPEKRSVERKDIALTWTSVERRFEASIELPVCRAMHDEAMSLEGSLLVETNRLLSGLEATWKPGDSDFHQPVRESYRTAIEVNFEGDMLALFKNRTSHVYRSWCFEGVFPTHARYNEVRNLLTDVGFTVLRRTGVHDSVIEAVCREQGLPTVVRLRLHGQEEIGHHVLHFDQERQQIERDITLGSLQVECEITGEGNLSPVINRVDDLFARLLQRWNQTEPIVLQGTWYKGA
ncbi:MAG: hypothetical protein JW892_04410 [Anaerolineae bacterium]|nr:hypothetical protein [Anaerolineae bacterium]